MPDSNESSWSDNFSEKSNAEIVNELQARAIYAHQESVGRGDQLVKLLEDAINQMKMSNNRIIWLSTIFFVFGLFVLGLGVYMTFFDDSGKEAWGAIFGVSGGLAAAASIFYSGPITKISNSITNLIKLETAFLGYIRVVGEVDSAFQWQYIEKLGNPDKTTELETISTSTTNRMKDIMSETMKLIDEHVADETPSIKDLRKQLDEMKNQLEVIESKVVGE